MLEPNLEDLQKENDWKMESKKIGPLPLQVRRQKLHKMWSKNRDDLINDVSKPLEELVPSDLDAGKDARDSDSYMEDNDTFGDSDSSSEWEFEEAGKDNFDVESHRLYTDSDDTDDESWAPEDHGDEEGDDSYASDDDEAGGNEGKDVSDEDDTSGCSQDHRR